MTGSLAPPPPYGSEQGSILLEAGREGTRHHGQQWDQPPQHPYTSVAAPNQGHGRSRSGQIRIAQPVSPGPERSPTEISLAQLAHVPSNEDVGEGTSRSARAEQALGFVGERILPTQDFEQPPPAYTSPKGSLMAPRRSSSRHWMEEEDESYNDDDDREVGSEEDEEDEEDDNGSELESEEGEDEEEGRELLRRRERDRDSTPIPSYDAAVRQGILLLFYLCKSR